MNPSVSPDAFGKLYDSGLWIPLGILVLFELLTFLRAHVAWFEVGKHAAYTSAAIGGLAMLVVPATQGTTPNLQMLVAAFAAAYALMRNPIVGKSDSRPMPQASALLMILAIGVGIGYTTLQLSACSAAQKSAEHATLACAESAAAKDIEPVVVSILATGTATWEEQLIAFVGEFGADAVNCAVNAAEAEFAAKATAGSGSDTPIGRAREWIAKHGGAS